MKEINKKIKLIAIDMDGTLLNSEHKISINQKKILQKVQENGIQVVLCTGRPLYGAWKLYEELELNHKNGYMILNNGCEIRFTENKELIDYFQVTSDEIKELYAFIKNRNVDLSLFDDKHYYIVGDENYECHPVSEYDASLVYTTLTKIKYEDAISGDKLFFKAMYLGNIEVISELEKELPDSLKQKFNWTRSQPTILEALPSDASKAEALKKLSKILNISSENIMAIGDGNNDFEMLQFAGVSVAMKNGTELAKQAAKYTTDTNDNDGVYKAINKFVFNN